jgi:hypothetical protein
MIEDCTLELRAANGTRPVILQMDWQPGRVDALVVTGAADSSFSLDGLLIAGRSVQVKGKLRIFTLRHCTLVPGWTLQPDGHPRRAKDPSLTIENTVAHVLIERSILGPIEVIPEEDDVDPMPMQITDSILDATHTDTRALATRDEKTAPVVLTMQRCSVLGRVSVHAVRLAENSIFAGHVTVVRRQMGCVRFCYVPPGSRTPQRFHCQPDLVDRAVAERGHREHLPHAELSALHEAERFRVQPAFVSTRYGNPNYCRLADDCAWEIKTGADDESELGVFHSLYQPQRESNLRARLEEYVPAVVDVAILFAT